MRIKDFVLYPLINELVIEVKNKMQMTKEDFFNVDFSLSEKSNLMIYKVYSKYVTFKMFKELLGETEVVCKCRFCGKKKTYGHFTEFIPKLYKMATKGLETNGFYCSRVCTNKYLGGMKYHREEGRVGMMEKLEKGMMGVHSDGYRKWESRMKKHFGEDFRKKLIRHGKWEKPFFTEEARKKIAIKKGKWTNEQKKSMFEKRMETHVLNGTKMFGDNDKSYSLISKDFFDKLVRKVRRKYPDFGGEYAESERRVGKRYLDFYNQKYDIWIEFNGDYFHANPDIYNPDDEIVFSVDVRTTAKKIWSNDKKRINEVKKHLSIDPIIVWERKYRKDSKSCLNEIAEKVIEKIENVTDKKTIMEKKK